MSFQEYFIWLVSICMAVHISHAQSTCQNGIVIYEKSSATSVSLEARPERTVEMSPSEVPTSTCQRVCDGTPSCTAFSVAYTTRTCKIYSGTIQSSLLLSRPDSAFFEKTCLPDIAEMRFRAMCSDRLYAMERVRGASFNGPMARVDQNVPSRAICARICISENSFVCAAAIYDSTARTCALSTEDRRTQSSAFVDNSKSTEYMENQCVSDLRECQYLPQKGGRVISVDYITVAKTEEQCREDCNRNTAIICRSYTYEPTQDKCFLSSDDSISLLGVDLLIEEGLRYAERRCHHSGMGTNFPEGSQYQQGSTLQAVPFTGNNFIPSQQPYPTAMPNYLGGFRATHNYGQEIPMQIPFNNQYNPYMPNMGFVSAGTQTPYNVIGTTGYTVNPNYNPYGFMQGASLMPFGGNPNNPNFVNNQGYPGSGINRFDQEVADPRMFNSFNRGPYNNNGYNNNNNNYNNNNNNNGFNSFTSPERCTFEKITGLAVAGESQGPIPLNTFDRSASSQCVTWCRLQGPNRCPAFILDYINNQCNVLRRPADVAIAPGTLHGQSYFEQICFTTQHQQCEGKSWAFERFVHSELRGFDDRVLSAVNSVRDCEDACLKETQFLCLSAEYDSTRLECRLSRETRQSRAFAFQQSPNVDYLENQCVPPTSLSTCSPERQDGQSLLYADAIMNQIFTEDECRRACQRFTNFTCNAASYRQIDNECALSNSLATVLRPDSILLYTSCSQPNLVNPTFNNNNIGQPILPNYGQGNFGQGNFGQGNFGQGNFGQGNSGQGNFGQGNFGQGNFGQGNFGQGNFGQGQQFPAGFNGNQFTPQQQFVPNQFNTGLPPFTSVNQPTFNQGFPIQTPHFYNVGGFGTSIGQQPQGPQQSFPNQFPNNVVFTPTSSPIGPYQSGFQGTAQFQPGQQFPVSGQFAGTGQFSTVGPYPNQGVFPYQSNFPSSYYPVSQPNFPGPPPQSPYDNPNLSFGQSQPSSIGQSRPLRRNNSYRGSRLRNNSTTARITKEEP